MPRGGARPGAGRPKKDDPAKNSQPKLRIHAPAAEAVPVSDLSPLDYLLSIVRDANAEEKLRIQAASIAAPYVHAKKGEGGKKEAKDAAAKQVAGRFSASAPPKLVAAGGKKV